MELSLDRPEGFHVIRAVSDRAVLVDDREFRGSVVVSPDRLEDWPPGSAGAIEAAHLEQLLALEPELIVLGTGPRQVFLPPQLQALVLSRGVGLEIMANAAAARTYDVLAGEGRRVVAALVLPG